MKIKVIIIILFVISIDSYAQLFKGFGIKTGVSVSTQDWNYRDYDIEIADSDFKGFYFGIFAEGLNYGVFSSIFEVTYLQKGLNTQVWGTIIAQNEQGYLDIAKFYFQNSFDYISLSLSPKFRYETNPIVPYIIVGPRLDFQINKCIEFGNVSHKFNKTTWGYFFGGGFIYNNLTNINLLVEFVSSPDISNLYNTDLLEVSKYSYEIKIGILFK